MDGPPPVYHSATLRVLPQLCAAFAISQGGEAQINLETRQSVVRGIRRWAYTVGLILSNCPLSAPMERLFSRLLISGNKTRFHKNAIIGDI
jgi:hypothetical protein